MLSVALNIQKVLVSQPTPVVKEKSPFYEFSTEHGVDIDYRPLIRVEGIPIKEFRAQRVDILQHTAVIFTSRTTIDSFFSLCETSRVTVPEGMKYICQTEAVALYLQKYIVYRKRKISFGDGTFKSLVELIVKNRSEKMLLTLSDPHKPELPEAMEQLEINFTQAILAHTVSADMTGVEIDSYQLVALYSPSDVKALVESFGKDRSPMLAVFGRATLAAAHAAGVSVKAMAPTAEAPSMVKAIELLTQKLERGEEVPDVELSDDNSQVEFLKSQQCKMAKRPRVRSTATKK